MGTDPTRGNPTRVELRHLSEARVHLKSGGVVHIVDRLDLSFMDTAVLLETPNGFGLFNLDSGVLKAPKNVWSWFAYWETAEHVSCMVDYVKVEDKSSVWRSDGPGEVLSNFIWKYCRDEKDLIVGDEKLKGVIKSNMEKVKLLDNDYVARELVWGFKNVLSGFCYDEKDNITPEYLLPVSEGLKESMRKLGINVPTEAITDAFIRNAGSLHRCHVMVRRVPKDLRKACDKIVPGIGGLIDDDLLYAKVMAKILTPEEMTDWEFSMSFPPDMVLKLQKADAAADDARKQMDNDMFRFIYSSIADLERLPGLRTMLVRKLKAYAKKWSRKQLQTTGKRSHAGVDGAAETSRGADEDSQDASSEGNKKVKAVEV